VNPVLLTQVRIGSPLIRLTHADGRVTTHQCPPQGATPAKE
jgi:hypothetical protein